ncbi:MAG: hypothetical protein LBF97_08255 [Elusimicrobiota bacterium]|jgi:hypothetical protein|nr:hypothetical protein [Elusimicrobiota bacterium]
MFKPLKNILEKERDLEGWVDITSTNKRTGEIVYKNSGDNVVTDWMRHTLLMLLTGASFSRTGTTIFPIQNPSATNSRNSPLQFTTLGGSVAGGGTVLNISTDYHQEVGNSNSGINLDGYLIHDKQYFWKDNNTSERPTVAFKYSQAYNRNGSAIFAHFPTKILFGTGKEYANWDTLQEENETANAAWYNELKNKFGGSADLTVAKNTFNENIAMLCNKYSGSIANNLAAGNSGLLTCRTVNDPNSTSVINTTSLASKDWGIMGAIKTPYFSSAESTDFLNDTITTEGKTLRPQYQGIGRPAFIYFTNESVSEAGWGIQPYNEYWDSPANAICVSLSKDTAKTYLHRISFHIYMPSQTGAENATGAYYPYNGYVLKQMGLFNDTLLKTAVSESNIESTSNWAYRNMPCGVMLAKKNITPFYKSADTDLDIIWTLSI